MVSEFTGNSSIFKFVLLPSDFSAEGYDYEAKQYIQLSQLTGESKAERKENKEKLLAFLADFVDQNQYRMSGQLRRKIQYWRWAVRVTPVFEGSKELHALKKRKKEAFYQEKRAEERSAYFERKSFRKGALVYGGPALFFLGVSLWMMVLNHIQISQVPMPEVVLYYRYWFFLILAALFAFFVSLSWWARVREWTYYMFIHNKTDLGRLIFVVPMVLVCLSPAWVLYIDSDFYTRKRFYNKTYDFGSKGYQRCTAFDLGGWGIEGENGHKKIAYLIPQLRYGYVKKELFEKYECDKGE